MAESPRTAAEERASKLSDLYVAAGKRGTLHRPEDLRTRWARVTTPVTQADLEEFVKRFHTALGATECRDSASVAICFARLLEQAVLHFERFVCAGLLDDVLPRLAALPVLYSPDAGSGAGQWDWPCQLFREKRVGSEAFRVHVGAAPGISKRRPIWVQLAAETIYVLRMATGRYAEFAAMRDRATDVANYRIRHDTGNVRAKYEWRADIFLFDHDHVLVWPDWLDHCKDLPTSPLPATLDSTARQQIRAKYVGAAKLVLEGFFGDPTNPYLDDMIGSITATEDGAGNTNSSARAEAIRMVLKNVKKLL